MLVASRRAMGANDRIRIALVGTGGRCMYLAELLKSLPGNEIVAACDVYEPHRLEAVEKFGPQTRPSADYREVLDRNDIDAVVIGAPDHWHVTMTLDAVAAGKDVYCEKPVTHTIEEGDRLIAGVEKSKRVSLPVHSSGAGTTTCWPNNSSRATGSARSRWPKCTGIRTT